MEINRKEGKNPFPLEAAKASWMIFVLIIFLSAFTQRILAARVIIELLIFFLSLTAIILAIVALCNIPKYGAKKILFPAITGLILNTFLIFIFIINFISSYYRNR